jgi:hypothetical protein
MNKAIDDEIRRNYQDIYYKVAGVLTALEDSFMATYPKPDNRGTFTRAQIDELRDLFNRLNAILAGFG